MAIVPVDTLGVSSAEGAALDRVLLREVGKSRTVSPTPVEKVRRAMGQKDGKACRDSESCLAALGRRVAADVVLSTTLAGLGDMRLIRARLVRSRDELLLQDLQETIPGGSRLLEERAAGLARRLFPQKSQPWYRKWWVWATVAAAAVAVGVTWYLVDLSTQEETDPNVTRIGDL